MLLGLDFSEEFFAAILADEGGQTLVALRAELPRGGASAQWLAAMNVARAAMLQGHAALSQITNTCIAFFAPLDENGIARKDARSASWANYDLPRALREHLNVPSAFAAPRVLAEAIAEERLGALRSTGENSNSDWLYLHIGASIEAAARVGGVLVRGANHSALEIGAICIERGGALSDGGKRGSLNGYCGGDALVARARSYGLASSTPRALFDAANSNAMAQSVRDDFVERLAQGIGATLSVLNPARLVVGGEVGHELGDALVVALRPRLGEYCALRHVENLEITMGQLGRDAAVLGAVSLARAGWN